MTIDMTMSGKHKLGMAGVPEAGEFVGNVRVSEDNHLVIEYIDDQGEVSLSVYLLPLAGNYIDKPLDFKNDWPMRVAYAPRHRPRVPPLNPKTETRDIALPVECWRVFERCAKRADLSVNAWLARFFQDWGRQ